MWPYSVLYDEQVKFSLEEKENKHHYFSMHRKVEMMNPEEGFYSFYRVNVHSKVGQELHEFLLLRRLGQIVKDCIDNDAFIRQTWKCQHQQLRALFCTQECQDFNLKGSEWRKNWLLFIITW